MDPGLSTCFSGGSIEVGTKSLAHETYIYTKFQNILRFDCWHASGLQLFCSISSRH